MVPPKGAFDALRRRSWRTVDWEVKRFGNRRSIRPILLDSPPGGVYGEHMASGIAAVRIVLTGILRPIEAFFRLQAASGLALLISAVIAMVWVNVSPATYNGFFQAPLTLDARTFA